ncbi:glutamate--cysteine ligase [Streptomyces vinaceus]|uniref:carboxylate-amine ligase n=1 Tax=Streptomyces vinaceus TaxID=1960 RepID=UPI0035DD05A2
METRTPVEGPTAPTSQGAPSSGSIATLTLGVEEEFLIVDAATWRPAPVASEVLSAAGGTGPRIQGEATRYQVELASPVAATADELRAALVSLRTVLAGAARELGCRLVASPVPVLNPSGPTKFRTDLARHLAIQGRFGELAQTLTACGQHVHVGSLDIGRAVAVANRLRPWVPTLIALGANSPYAGGRDTGHASWRTVSWSGWPSAGTTPYFETVSDYERAVRHLIAAGAALDPHMVYWDLRPSRKWPTLEVRAPDVMPDVDHAVLLAVLSRALVTTALWADREGLPVPPVSDEFLRLARWRAAHDGLEGAGLDPFTGDELPAAGLVQGLLKSVEPALSLSGDLDFASQAIDGMLRDGSWAARQRKVFARRGELTDVIRFLADETERA